MKAPDKLETVVEVATRKRDDALQALARAQREYHSASMQMTQLRGYTQESLSRWSERASRGVTAQLLHTHQTFMGKLDHAVSFQGNVMERLQHHMAHCQQQVMQAERELASLNKYIDRRHQTWQRQLHRQDQKSNDEMAATQHRQHATAHPWRHTP
jgi:flagellar protein FliJ